MIARALLLLALLLSARIAAAHELAPSVLDLRELGGGRVEVIWRPAPESTEAPVFPEACARERGEDTTSDPVDPTAPRRFVITCASHGLAGERVSVRGMSLGRGDALLRYTDAAGASISAILRADAPSFTMPGGITRAAPLAVARTYFGAGVEHLFAGWDHLLFVFGLLLLVPRRRALFWAITAFTAAHSLALALAIAGLLRVPPAPAEAVIALSLLLVAGEVDRARTKVEAGAEEASLARRRPWIPAFVFGLVHGLGFAGGLRELGLPAGQIPLALASFNLGIEAAQLAFVAVAIATSLLAPARASRVPATVIGSFAWFFLLTRVAAFWTLE